MSRLFSRPLVPTTILIAAFVLALAWYRECTGPQRKAQEIWSAHERVIVDVAMKRRVNLGDFQDARYFFEKLTGVDVPGNYSTYLGTSMPNKDTATALEPLRHWYAENQDRLYWDEEQGAVRLAPE